MGREGLEAFATRETWEAVAPLMVAKDRLSFLESVQAQTPGPWRILGIAMDQCSVGVCAVNFLRNRMRLLVGPLSDPSHRVGNDMLAGIKAVGFFPVLLAMKLCYSLNDGSWEGGKWWRVTSLARTPCRTPIGVQGS